MNESLTIHPGVAMIIFDEEKRILLQKRRDVALWGIPSGHVEPGETVKEAAVREVLEETNLHVEIERLIGVYSEPASQIFHYPNGKMVHFITLCFLAKIVGGELVCNLKESLELTFFDVNELPKALLPMHPAWLKDALANEQTPFIR